MTGLTTQALDMVRGVGATGMRVELRQPGGAVTHTLLDANGRATLLHKLSAGAYEITFHTAAYYGAAEFYDVITVRFLIHEETGQYHVPLVFSPFGYSTHRGGGVF